MSKSHDLMYSVMAILNNTIEYWKYAKSKI